jgi:hypothetical protein
MIIPLSLPMRLGRYLTLEKISSGSREKKPQDRLTIRVLSSLGYSMQ